MWTAMRSQTGEGGKCHVDCHEKSNRGGWEVSCGLPWEVKQGRVGSVTWTAIRSQTGVGGKCHVDCHKKPNRGGWEVSCGLP